MMTTQNAPRTARERARAELTREIAEEARRQLAASGANGLSLRAVAKELGMVSSAVYRYYPSRDDLLTALIIDAYDAVGEAAEQAMAGPGPARARWLAGCRAIRRWALDRPHEYALIYGSPVPGYRAPEATVGPAARVPFAFVGVLAGAVSAGEIVAGGGAGGSVAGEAGAEGAGGEAAGGGAESGRGALTGELAAQAATLSGILAQPGSGVPGAGVVPPDMLVRGVIAWTQLFGMLSWELFGQFVGSFDPADAFFEHAIGEQATFVGLR
jgi:AcrR family transcriptional regulator